MTYIVTYIQLYSVTSFCSKILNFSSFWEFGTGIIKIHMNMWVTSKPYHDNLKLIHKYLSLWTSFSISRTIRPAERDCVRHRLRLGARRAEMTAPAILEEGDALAWRRLPALGQTLRESTTIPGRWVQIHFPGTGVAFFPVAGDSPTLGLGACFKPDCFRPGGVN